MLVGCTHVISVADQMWCIRHCVQVPGVHDAIDPEYSILKQRLARRVRYEGLDPTQMDLVDITHVAERTITNVRRTTGKGTGTGTGTQRSQC